MPKKRIRYIDTIKGLAILCVIVGHTIPEGIFRNIIYSVHMPIFFFISGIFFEKSSVSEIIRTKSNRLLLPYYGTCVVLFFGLSMKYFIKFGLTRKFIHECTEVLFSIAYAYGIETIIGTLWYLWALYWAIIFTNFLIGRKGEIIWVAALFLLGYYTSYFVWLPVNIQAGMTAVVYVYSGYKYKNRVFLQTAERPFFIFLFSMLVWLIIAYFAGNNIIANNTYTWFPLNIFCALIGIFSVFEYFKQLEKKIGNNLFLKKLEIVGNYSLVIFCIHLLEMRFLPWYKIKQILYSFGMITFSVLFVIIILKFMIAFGAIIVVKRSKFLQKFFF